MKTYVKPELFYESFELSQHIAACAWDVKNAATAEVCGAVSDGEWEGMPSGLTLFNSGNSNCNVNIENFEEYCYTNGESGNNIFNS